MTILNINQNTLTSMQSQIINKDELITESSKLAKFIIALNKIKKGEIKKVYLSLLT